MSINRKKPRFKVGEIVNLSVKIVKVDRRYKPELYTIEGLVAGWVLSDSIEPNELRPLTKRGRGQ